MCPLRQIQLYSVSAEVKSLHVICYHSVPGASVRLGGKLLLISGRDGSIIRQALVPDHRESYFSPVLYDRQDGTEVVLFGTGGETHGGGLWVISLHDLIKGQIHKVS